MHVRSKKTQYLPCSLDAAKVVGPTLSRASLVHVNRAGNADEADNVPQQAEF